MTPKNASGLRRGDTVEWNTSQGPTRGTVVGQVSAPTRIDGYTAKASPANPEIEVRSAASGRHAVHHAEALRKVGRHDR